MRLSELVAALPSTRVSGPDVDVRAIRTDSRTVEAGDLFVAYPGVTVDGHGFVPGAVERGAAAVVVERHVEVPAGVARVFVSSGRAAWALLTAAWHGFPSRELTVVGVTGTDGKTTTSSLIGAILEAAHIPTGLVTTVAAEIAGQSLDTGFHTTTPEPPEIQAYLRSMVAKGCQVAVLETTSHALALDKVLGIDYDLAVVTNITHEHLDFHGTWHAYLEAKARLFEGLAASARKPGVPKTAVLNAEDASFGRLSGLPYDRRFTYAVAQSADLMAREVVLDGRGMHFVATTPRGEIPIEARLLGRFNVSNALAAVGAALALDIEPAAIKSGLARFRGVPGRLEAIDLGQDFSVVVDFAHTPNSLRRVLELGRTLTKGRVLVVFGCAGERDAAKRPLMGQAAGELADAVYLTAEDPRREDLVQILGEIATGVRAAGGDPMLVSDRGEAVAAAIAAAAPGDLVLICGKGHEQTMAFGDEERPWDDRAAARAALGALGWART